MVDVLLVLVLAQRLVIAESTKWAATSCGSNSPHNTTAVHCHNVHGSICLIIAESSADTISITKKYFNARMPGCGTLMVQHYISNSYKEIGKTNKKHKKCNLTAARKSKMQTIIKNHYLLTRKALECYKFDALGKYQPAKGGHMTVPQMQPSAAEKKHLIG